MPVGHIEKGPGRTGKQPLLINRIRVPGNAHAGGESQFSNWFISIHRIEVQVAGADSLFERDGIALGGGVSRAISELREIVVDDARALYPGPDRSC